MSKAQSKVKINQVETKGFINSPELEEYLKQIAEELIAGDSRYTIETSRSRKTRKVVNIIDKSDDALSYEAKTGSLGRLAKKRL